MRKAVPSSHIRLIERTRLLRRLDDWRVLRLIRVTAPAGFGKTTLASTWLQRLGDGPAIAWLSLDAEDDALDVLLQHIEESLQSELPALAAMSAMERAGRMTSAQMVRLLCAEVAAAGREFILVLDDCHLLRAADVLAVLQDLFDQAPPNLHLVLLSRETVPVRVGRNRLQGAVLDMVTPELALDHEEFAAFVRGSALEGLDAERLADIERRADGWIAGLQMLSMARHARAPLPDEAWQAGIVAEFMEYEVFRRMSRDLRTFLIETALLPWLTPGAAAAVSGLDEAECAGLLATAAAENTFVVPLTTSTDATYRCHPLLQEFLLRKLQDERTPAQVRAQRLRTATWLGAHGEVDAALTILKPIGAWDEAAAIVAAVSRSAILSMDLSSLRRWLARLPADVVDRTPQLAVDAAWLAFLSDMAEMRAPVTRAWQALDAAAHDAAAHDAAAHDAAAPCADVDELRAELCAIETVCDLAVGDLPAAQNTLQRAARISHASNGLAAGYLSYLNSCAPVDSSDAEHRIQLLIRSEQIFQAVGFDYGSAEAATARGLIKRRYADMHHALASFHHAASVIRRSGWEHSLANFDCRFACGEMLYEMNQIAAARDELQQAMRANQFSDSALATMHLARLLNELCDYADADAGVVPVALVAPMEDDDVWADIVATINPIIVAHVGWYRIRRDLCAGRLERCWHTVETMHVLPADLRAEMPDLQWIAVLTGAMADRRQLPLIRARLEQFRHSLEESHNAWMLLRVRVLQVLHFSYGGDSAAAAAELEALLPKIEQSGMLRLILDWPQLAPLLAQSRSPFAYRLRKMLNRSVVETIPFGLTKREFEMLQDLVNDFSTTEIAQKRFIEIDTLRRYLVRMYRKMGVHSRAEAVHAAREAGVG
jgi:LuxR family maltose regulon positive regulatory protein